MQRRFWLLVPGGFFLVSVLGFFLQAHPSGLGTHRALGLPNCLFLEWTRLPCPSCGLTTSFTHLLHGHLSEAFAVHPLGPVLFLGFALVAACSLAEYFNRKTPLSRILKGANMTWAYAALTVFLGTWMFRLVSIWQIFPER